MIVPEEDLLAGAGSVSSSLRGCQRFKRWTSACIFRGQINQNLMNNWEKTANVNKLMSDCSVWLLHAAQLSLSRWLKLHFAVVSVLWTSTTGKHRIRAERSVYRHERQERLNRSDVSCLPLLRLERRARSAAHSSSNSPNLSDSSVWSSLMFQNRVGTLLNTMTSCMQIFAAEMHRRPQTSHLDNLQHYLR